MKLYVNKLDMTAVSENFGQERSIYPPSFREPSAGWSVWTAAVAIISIAISLDHFDLFQTSVGKAFLSFAAVGLLVYYALSNQFRLNLPPWPLVLWILLMMVALPGIMYTKSLPTQGLTPTSTLYCAMSMGLLIASVAFIPKRLLRINPTTAMNVLGGIGFIFLAGSFVGLAGFGYSRIPSLRIHERAFLLTLPLVVAFLNRRLISAFVCLFMMAVVLMINARTTIFLTYVTTIAFLIYHKTSLSIRMIALPIVVVLFAAMSFNAYEIVKIVNSNVKKNAFSSDNSSFREEIWNIGKQEFELSPIYGSMFTRGGSYDYGHTLSREATGEITESTFVPLHNDYLEIFASGGLIGGLLFTGALLGFLFMGLGNAGKCRRVDLLEHMKYNQVLTTLFACAMICMMVNPVINNTQAGFFVYAIASLIVMENYHLKMLGVR